MAAPETNDTGTRMFALEKAVMITPLDPHKNTAQEIVDKAKVFMDFLKPAPAAVSSIVGMNGASIPRPQNTGPR